MAVLIDISNIIKSFQTQMNINVSSEIESLNNVIDTVVFDGPVLVRGILTNTGEVINLEGNIKALYTAKCSRCLKEFKCELSVDVNENFTSRCDALEEEFYIYTGTTLNLDKMVIDVVALELPFRQECSKDCKGLCPNCGTDLNKMVCNCKPKDFRMQQLGIYFNHKKD